MSGGRWDRDELARCEAQKLKRRRKEREIPLTGWGLLLAVIVMPACRWDEWTWVIPILLVVSGVVADACEAKVRSDSQDRRG